MLSVSAWNPRSPDGGPRVFFWQVPDYKPVFVPLRAIAIHLGHTLLHGSSDLPGSGNGASRSSSPIWSCSAWGLPCQPDYSVRGALLPHHFTLTSQSLAEPTGGIFSVALSVKTPLRDPPRPLAGTLPCGDRTFLSLARAAIHPAPASAQSLMHSTPAFSSVPSIQSPVVFEWVDVKIVIWSRAG